MTLEKLDDPPRLRVLSGLEELELLDIGCGSPLDDECLRHLAGLTRLRALEFRVEVGDGEGLRHLAGLHSLEFLSLHGEAVTDAGLRHLEGLARLRVVQVPWTRATRRGARRLAEALPDVAIHLESAVIRTPRPTVRFRRVAIGDFASALIPVGWVDQGGSDAMDREWWEDGYARYDEDWDLHGFTPTPAILRMWVGDTEGAEDAGAYLRDQVRDEMGRLPRRLEMLEEKANRATALHPSEGWRGLTAVALRNRRAAGVTGTASRGRFDRFRGLFGFIAGSLRVGSRVIAADEEEVVVDVSELER